MNEILCVTNFILYVISISPKIVYTMHLPNVSKCKYWEWIHILHLELLVKSLAIWFTIAKTQEIRVKWPSIKTCDMMLKIFYQRLQLFNLKMFNKSSYEGVMSVKNDEIHNLGISRLPLWIPKHFIHLM